MQAFRVYIEWWLSVMSARSLELEQAQSLKLAHWSVRLLYFSFFGGMGLFFTFLNVYYISIGLSGLQVGILGTIGPLVGVFSSILWGMASDRFGRPRLLFGLTALGSLGAVLALSGVREFLWIIPMVIWLSLFSSSMPSMMDSMTFRLLGNRPELFGRYRMFGTIGFVLSSALSGFLYERFGLPTLFPAFGVMLGLYFIGSFGLPNQPIALRASMLEGLGRLIRQPAWAMFAASVLVLWISATGAISFVSVAIRSMGGSDRLIGFNWTIAALVELPMMFFSAPLLKRFGAERLVSVAFIGYFLRILFYGLIPSAEWALAANVFHAFSYVPFIIGAASYANHLAPPDLKATSQGLLFAVMNLGNVFGAILGGWLYDVVGVAALFRILAFVALAGFFLFVFGRMWLRRGAVRD